MSDSGFPHSDQRSPTSTATPPRTPHLIGEPESSWGARVAGGILALFALAVLEVGIVSAFDPNIETLGARLVTQALLAVTLVGIAFALVEPGPAGPAAALGLRAPFRSPVALAASAYLAYVAFALLYAALVNPQQEDVTRDLGYGQGDLGNVASALLIIGAAPVSEELFFRGFVFGGLRQRLSFLPAALIPAVVWGLMHYTGPDSIGVVPQLAFFGLVLAWVYEKTRSLWPAIAVHAVNNALAFALLTL